MSSRASSKFQEQIQHFVELIRSGRCKNIIVLAGAGLSVASGIPDFRSASNGLYATLSSMRHFEFRSPTFVFDIDEFMKDPRPFWWIFSRLWPKGDFPKPTPFHYLITLLERHNLLRRCFTQNVDGLEANSGLSAERICYCHGVLSTCHCKDCKAEVSFAYCLNAIKPNFAHDSLDYKQTVVPTCPNCHGNHVKPDVTFFGEGLPRRYFQLSSDDAPEADMLVCVGTSLEVFPVADLPGSLGEDVERFVFNRDKVRQKGGVLRDFLDLLKTKLSILGNDYTGVFQYGNGRDWWIGGDLQSAALKIIEELGWNEEFETLKAEGEARRHQLQEQIE